MQIAFDAAPLMNTRTGVGHYAGSLLAEMLAKRTDARFDLFALTMSDDRSQLPVAPNVKLNHRRVPARIAVTAWELTPFVDGDVLTGDADVVHGTNFWVPPSRDRNAVVTIHDLTFHLYPELCTPQVQRYRWIVPRVLKRVALAIVPSATIADQLSVELAFPRDRIVVTPEGVRGTFTRAVADPSVATSIGVEGDYVLFAGTQEPRKNLDRLIQAMNMVQERSLSLVIAGPPGWGSVDLPALAHRYGLDQRVRFTGYLTDDRLGALMKGARAFIFPTLYEGFGLPPLEAMAAGIPVVAARSGSLPEVLGDAAAWCEATEAASIAEAIDAVVSDEELRARLIAAGRERASAFDWSVTGELTWGAYEMAAGG